MSRLGWPPGMIGAGYRPASTVRTRSPARRCPLAVGPASSRYNQAFALLQSRITVIGETPKVLWRCPPRSGRQRTAFRRPALSRRRVARAHSWHRPGPRRRSARLAPHDGSVLQRDMRACAPPFHVATPRMVPTRMRRITWAADGKEMRPVLPLHAFVVDQADVYGFVDERRRLQAVAGALLASCIAAPAGAARHTQSASAGRARAGRRRSRRSDRADVVGNRFTRAHEFRHGGWAA